MNDLTPERADALWDELRDAFANLENAIRLIVDTKAWLPLGYETFASAWSERMKGVALANSVKPYVIYAMLDEGLALEDVAEVTGFGIDQVGRAAEDYRIGVPVEGATVVRQHIRRAKGAQRAVRVEFETGDFHWLKDVSKRFGRDLNREAKLAIVAWFEAIEERESRKTRAS